MVVSPKGMLRLEYALITISIAIPVTYMNVILNGSPGLFTSFSISLLVGLPFLYLPAKWRVLSLFPVWIVAIFYLSNTCYLRFFNEFIPFQNFFLIGNIGTDLFCAGLEMLKMEDIVTIVPALISTVWYVFSIVNPGRNTGFSVKERVMITAFAVCAFLASEYHTSMYQNNASHISGNLKQMLTRYDFHDTKYSPLKEYCDAGLIGFFYRGLAREIYGKLRTRSLTHDEIEMISEYQKLHDDIVVEHADSAYDFSGNCNKNLIFIVVESLNAWVVNYEYDGRKIMPVLSELIHSDGVISSELMYEQIRWGTSSDAQFIYNTGMYPAIDLTTVSEYMGNDLPSIAKKLKPRKSFEIICESPSLWNHFESNKAYGFDYFFYNTDRRAHNLGIGRDKAMFDTSIEVIDTISQPFFGLLTTMSMHTPYMDKKVKQPGWIRDIPEISPAMRNYLTVSNYFDTCLGEFIDDLKRKGVYENTIITIASDHTAYVEGSGYDYGFHKTVFVITGSGITLHSTTPMGQVDVFPTILQIMNEFSPDSYSGMGFSMLNPSLNGVIGNDFQIYGDSISVSLKRLLENVWQVADIKLKTNSCLP